MGYYNEDHTHDKYERQSKDRQKEKCVSNFLEKYFYPLLNVETEIVTDRETQLKGVDKKFTYNGYDYLCDEKAATGDIYYDRSREDYRQLPTFCMECFHKPKYRDYVKGWFIKEDNITNSYLLVWVDDALRFDYSTQDNWDEVINEVECVLVRKERIVEYLEEHGVGLSEIENAFDTFERDNNLRYVFTNDIKFQRCNNLEERAINILIKRDVYRSLSDFNVVLRRNPNDNRIYRVRRK